MFLLTTIVQHQGAWALLELSKAHFELLHRAEGAKLPFRNFWNFPANKLVESKVPKWKTLGGSSTTLI